MLATEADDHSNRQRTRVAHVAAHITTSPQRLNWLQCGEAASAVLRGQQMQRSRSAREEFQGAEERLFYHKIHLPSHTHTHTRAQSVKWWCVTESPSYRCGTCQHSGTSGSDSIGICCGTFCECGSEDHSGRRPALIWLCVWRNPAKIERET